MKGEYSPYPPRDIHTMLNEPRKISGNPYMLHAAYALSCLFDICSPDNGDDEEAIFAPDDMWGCRLPKSTVDRLVADVALDFNDAANTRKPIRIWGKPYSIRRASAYDHARLNLIFQFPLSDGEYTVAKDGIMRLSGTEPDMQQKYETSLEHARANILYLRQVIKMAEDDAQNGWDKLTDMEVAMYCWARFCHKHRTENWILFQKKYKDYIYVSEQEMIGCFDEKASLRKLPIGMYTFSSDKVQEWNEANGQKSTAKDIPQQEAEDYWYEKALATTFKPTGF